MVCCGKFMFIHPLVVLFGTVDFLHDALKMCVWKQQLQPPPSRLAPCDLGCMGGGGVSLCPFSGAGLMFLRSQS